MNFEAKLTVQGPTRPKYKEEEWKSKVNQAQSLRRKSRTEAYPIPCTWTVQPQQPFPRTLPVWSSQPQGTVHSEALDLVRPRVSMAK
ncbi:hypothetical protein ACOMHN_066049 [Nucella lapillus]